MKHLQEKKQAQRSSRTPQIYVWRALGARKREATFWAALSYLLKLQINSVSPVLHRTTSQFMAGVGRPEVHISGCYEDLKEWGYNHQVLNLDPLWSSKPLSVDAARDGSWEKCGVYYHACHLGFLNHTLQTPLIMANARTTFISSPLIMKLGGRDGHRILENIMRMNKDDRQEESLALVALHSTEHGNISLDLHHGLFMRTA